MLKTIGQNLSAALSKIAAALPDLFRELVGLAGIGLIAYGAWLVYVPAGFVVAGLLLLIGAILAGMKR